MNLGINIYNEVRRVGAALLAAVGAVSGKVDGVSAGVNAVAQDVGGVGAAVGALGAHIDTIQGRVGVPVRQRLIWTGADRALPGQLVRQMNAYRPRPQTSPLGIALESVTHNGSVYLGFGGGTTWYTSPDLVTFTARVFSSGAVNIRGLAVGANLFGVSSFSGSQALNRSTDNGASWASVGAVNITQAVLCTAGGVGYLLTPGNSTAFIHFTAAGVMTNKNFPAAATWGGVVHNGAAWLAFSADGVAAYSSNGADFTMSASYAAERVKLPANPTAIYALGSRFIAVALSGTTFSTIYSDDNGVTWQQGAAYGQLFEGRFFGSVNPDAVVLDGHLYISAKAGGVGFLMSTANGVTWRTHADINVADSAPGLYRRVGANTFFLNTAVNTGPPLEINLLAKELFYEL
ncbi:sialidase family protein [Acidovorax sp. LjRoot194]|uniref:sialidase family protein n=1 Tax=Acidovorax sp. LjRoot194 TaxID=3342280 RepID=UPI003ECD01E8